MIGRKIPPPLIKQSISNRKKITLNKGRYRCCYLLQNGKRCSKNAIGYSTYRGQKRFFITCPQHFKICTKRYISYKLSCARVFKNIKNLNKCNTYKNNRRTNALAHIQNCSAGRIKYPQRCTYGCLRFPGSKEAKRLLLKHDRRHEHVLNKLTKCRRNLTK